MPVRYDGGVVAVHVLRVLLVEGHDHRPLLARLVVVGHRQDALQPHAVLVLVVEQHAVAPQEVRLLRVGVGDLLRVLEAGARHAQVGKLDERLAREEERVGLRGLDRRAERRVLVHELLQLPAGQLVEAGLLRVLAVRRERDGLGQVDRPARRRQRAAPGPGSGGSVRTMRNRISFFVPTPFVRLRGADPSSGSSHRSYRWLTMTALPSLV